MQLNGITLRLCNYLQDQNILHSSQIGFLRGYRTTDHIFAMRTLVDKYVINANKGKLFCRLADFQKAFDSIWHEGLFLNNRIDGSFHRLISGMYFKSKCAIRYGNQRTNFFEFNRGVRQGCIVSPVLFNLYLNELPRILDCHDTDPVTLPNGLPLNCLLYADDLVSISRSAAGLQNQINLLHKYCEKWLLTTNLKRQKP